MLELIGPVSVANHRVPNPCQQLTWFTNNLLRKYLALSYLFVNGSFGIVRLQARPAYGLGSLNKAKVAILSDAATTTITRILYRSLQKVTIIEELFLMNTFSMVAMVPWPSWLHFVTHWHFLNYRLCTFLLLWD